jgi:hypothetical protein
MNIWHGTTSGYRQWVVALYARDIWRCLCEGAGKTNRRTPPLDLLFKSQTQLPAFFLVRFWAFLGIRGVQKHHANIFTKSQCRKNSNKSTKISMSPFLDFFVLPRFQVLLRDRVQKHNNKTLRKKKIASKSFYKNFDQKNQKQISS